MAIEEAIGVVAAQLGAIARQIETNGLETAEAWIAEHHDDATVRGLLVAAVLMHMDAKQRLGEAPDQGA